MSVPSWSRSYNQPYFRSNPVRYTMAILSEHACIHEDRIEFRVSEVESLDTTLLFQGFEKSYHGEGMWSDGEKISWSGSNLTELCFAFLNNGADVDLVSSLRDFCEEYLARMPRGSTFYKLACPEAIAPYRKNHSDAGFDLHLVKKLKSENGIDFYTTGVILEPPPLMWYMLVARSSMAKSGYVLANGVGIIDSSYRGEVIVALRKTSEDSPSIELPARMVQVIPQQWFYTGMVEKKEVSSTSRGDQGGLGSKQFSDYICTSFSQQEEFEKLVNSVDISKIEEFDSAHLFYVSNVVLEYFLNSLEESNNLKKLSFSKDVLSEEIIEMALEKLKNLEELVINSHLRLSSEFLEKIKSAYPRVNIVWTQYISYPHVKVDL